MTFKWRPGDDDSDDDNLASKWIWPTQSRREHEHTAEPAPRPAPTIMEYINELKRRGQWRYDLEMPVRPGEFVDYTSDNSGTVYMVIKDGSGYINARRVVGGPGSSGYHPMLR